MSPARLGEAIEATLHSERRRAVTVVERRMPYHDGSAVKLAATVPWLLWEHFRMLSAAERVSWLVWIGVWAVARAAIHGRATKSVARLAARPASPLAVPDPTP